MNGLIKMKPALVLSCLLPILGWAHAAIAAQPELIQVRKIWDRAPHNAFTDLIRFRDRWLCVFREGEGHVSPDGAVRVISSMDGKDWRSDAVITSANADLRDPKICVTPKGELMLSAAGALHQPAKNKHQTFAWFSRDGIQWGDPVEIGEPNLWLWRITWNKEAAYGVGYDTSGERFVRLYRSEDGRRFDTLVPDLFHAGYPNESSIVFIPDGTALCLLRRDGQPGPGLLGSAKPPYREWTWKDLAHRIGGPHMLRLPDGRFVAVTRLYDGGARTSLSWIDPVKGQLEECLKLPSGGDNSYAGIAWHNERLWISYYSSHEGKTSIYLAEVKLP